MVKQHLQIQSALAVNWC